MVKEDAVEDLGQVSVQVLWDIATDILGLSELVLNALKSFLVNAHNYFSFYFKMISNRSF